MKIYEITSDKERLRNELKRIGVDPYALKMDRKGFCLNLSVSDIKPASANVIKQEAIASGMDAALKRGAVSCSIEKTDVLLMGVINSYERLIRRLKVQPFGLKDLAFELENFLVSQKKEPEYLNARGMKISFENTKVMGILNVTPDSFSDGGKYINDKSAENRIDEMIRDGVDIIDIGGMSSRPGAEIINSEEEIKRIERALDYALKKGAVVSLDTCNFNTAKFGLEKGVRIINDISGLSFSKMRDVCAEYNAAVCIMHMLGTPKDMQKNICYNDLMKDIKDYLYNSVELAIDAGISRESLIIDPGFGFGKTFDQNYILLKYLEEFKSFGLPILAGISRKAMTGNLTGQPVSERLTATIALNSAAILNGASIIRVHDVAQGVETAKVIDYLKKNREK